MTLLEFALRKHESEKERYLTHKIFSKHKAAELFQSNVKFYLSIDGEHKNRNEEISSSQPPPSDIKLTWYSTHSYLSIGIYQLDCVRGMRCGRRMGRQVLGYAVISRDSSRQKRQ